MSSVTSEATDCSQEGPGLPPKWPYRLLPDRSGLFKIDEEIPHFKITFSMARTPAIADIALTRVAALGLNPILPRLGFFIAKPCYRPPSDERHSGPWFLQYETAGNTCRLIGFAIRASDASCFAWILRYLFASNPEHGNKMSGWSDMKTAVRLTGNRTRQGVKYLIIM